MTIVRHLLFCLVLAFGFLPGPAGAVQPDEVLSDAKLEARARGLSAELRCMVCQNQSIDDSSATLARDLRLLVRERLLAGDTDGQVRDYLVSRYGDFILLNPPLRPETALLWGMPVLVLGTAVIGLLLARKRPAASPVPLDAAERAALEQIVGRG